ncbi:hypothetical protein [Scytonema sp. UIC 10036]|uniref:hypothetical protein n=1 Tax=Scytonema sp. UIC 10036 TaxID=2304196 RepID=UPI00325B87BB
MKLWNVTTCRKLRTFKGNSDRVISVSFSPEGNTIASILTALPPFLMVKLTQ